MKMSIKQSIIDTLQKDGHPTPIVAAVLAAMEIAEEQWNPVYRERYGTWVETIIYDKE